MGEILVSEETNRRGGGSLGKLVAACVVVALLIGAYFLRREVIERSDLTNDDASPAPRTPSNAPLIRTPPEVIDLMVEGGELDASDTVYDLGCGDGLIVIGCAKTTGCRGVGIEIEKDTAELARRKVQEEGLEDLVEIREGDVFEADFTDADCVVMYVLPWMIKKLYPKFQQLKPGTRIVSHNYGFGGDLDDLPPDERYAVNVPGDGPHRVYVWVTPLGKLKK